MVSFAHIFSIWQAIGNPTATHRQAISARESIRERRTFKTGWLLSKKRPTRNINLFPAPIHRSLWVHRQYLKPVSPPCDYRHNRTTRSSRPRPEKTRKIYWSHSARPGQVRSGQTRSGQFLMLGLTPSSTSLSSFSYSSSLTSYTTTPGSVLFISHVHRQAVPVCILTISQRRSLVLTPRMIISRITPTLKAADGSATIHMVPSFYNASSRCR